MLKIAIMGGTFNPIHYAHLICAEQIREGLDFDKIIFIPSARPPHKSPHGIIDPENRFEMVRIAIADNPNFEVSRIELDRIGKSYAIETIRELQDLYGVKFSISWIIGADQLIEFKIWKDWDELLKICDFIVMTRPNYPISNVPSDLIKRVEIFEVPEIAISATELRERIRSGRSIRYLVPPLIRDYISKNQLYK